MMKRTIGFGSYDAYPKTIIAQNEVYNKMSHHYRRLYSAKPCIDTGLKKQRNSSKERKLSVDWNSCRNRSTNASQTKLKCCPNQKDSTKYNYTRMDTNKQKDVLDCVEYVPFHPRILKSDVESKVRSLSVYHPPRKKNQPVAVEICDKSEKERCPRSSRGADEYEWTRENTSNASKLSSSDSAYTEEGDGMWSGGESRGGTPQSPNSCWSMDVRSADGPYISFLRAITDEVLRKGIFTNKALKKLFREHIEKNIHRLDLKRMESEVEKLQKELGIPKEDDMNETDFGLGSVNPEWYNSSKEIDSSSRDDLAVTESLEQLALTSEKESTESREDESSGTKKHQSSENREKTSENSAKVSSKKSLKDNDNDSSIGCEIMSDYSGSGDDKSS